MSVSPSDIVGAINFIKGVAGKVKDNQEELRRVADRLQYTLSALEENRNRDAIRTDEYSDALSAISMLVERAQKATKKQLKRSLGARIWSRDDIATDLRRISSDIDAYLAVHTIQSIDMMQVTQDKSLTTLSANVEVIMVKLAELDVRLNTPKGVKWSPSILSQAKVNISDESSGSIKTKQPAGAPVGHSTGAESQIRDVPKTTRADTDPPSRSMEALTLGAAPTQTALQRGVNPEVRSVHALAQAGRTTLHLSALKIQKRGLESDLTISVPSTATLEDIELAVKARGFAPPDEWKEDYLMFKVTENVSEFDATAPGGLQIAKTMPLLWWWNKYNEYHNIAPATTPGHTLVALGDGGKTIDAVGVEFRFHRTLRVPDTNEENKLPLDLGELPLIPVAQCPGRFPERIRKRGGFVLPMFEREALWLSFKCWYDKPAVKVSVGGVNVITGITKDKITPPSREQDYIVAGLQPWLDGIMTETGVVRQFVAMAHGKNYTVEEQVTGKAEQGGFQFDIFPRRREPSGEFYIFNMDYEDPLKRVQNGRTLQKHLTPAEQNVPIGSIVGIYPRSRGSASKDWVLSTYRRRMGNSASLLAEYIDWGSMLSGAPMGLAAGGKISQKIYLDPVSPRMYDEDSGQRFHVHILTPEEWEDIMGTLPPITPITPEKYKQHNIPWYTIADDHVAGLTSTSQVLSNIQSVAQLDEAAKQSQASELIDPDRPPACSLHPRAVSTCLFRPCAHTGCSACLGAALLQGSKCPKCTIHIKKFVGMKNPVPQVSRTPGGDEDEWYVSEMEDLALQAVDLGNITIIHLEEDQVAPLHRLEPAAPTPRRR